MGDLNKILINKLNFKPESKVVTKDLQNAIEIINKTIQTIESELENELNLVPVVEKCYSLAVNIETFSNRVNSSLYEIESIETKSKEILSSVTKSWKEVKDCENIISQINKFRMFTECLFYYEKQIQEDKSALDSIVDKYLRLKINFESIGDKKLSTFAKSLFEPKKNTLLFMLEEKYLDCLDFLFDSEVGQVQLRIDSKTMQVIHSFLSDCGFSIQSKSYMQLSRKFQKIILSQLIQCNASIKGSDQNSLLLNLKIIQMDNLDILKDWALNFIDILGVIIGLLKDSLKAEYTSFINCFSLVLKGDIINAFEKYFKAIIPAFGDDFTIALQWLTMIKGKLQHLYQKYEFQDYNVDELDQFQQDFFHYFVSYQVDELSVKIYDILNQEDFDSSIEVGLVSSESPSDLLNIEEIDFPSLKKIIEKENLLESPSTELIYFGTCRISQKSKKILKLIASLNEFFQKQNQTFSREFSIGVSRLLTLVQIFYTLFEEKFKISMIPIQHLILHNDFCYFHYNLILNSALFMGTEVSRTYFVFGMKCKKIADEKLNSIVSVQAKEIIDFLNESINDDISSLFKRDKRDQLNHTCYQLIAQVEKLCKQWQPILPSISFLIVLSEIISRILGYFKYLVLKLPDIRANECSILCSILVQNQEMTSDTEMTKTGACLLKQFDLLLQDHEKKAILRCPKLESGKICPTNRESFVAIMKVLDSSLVEISQMFRSGYFHRSGLSLPTELIDLLMKTFTISEKRNEVINEILRRQK